jgi:hypothetical protein
MAPNSLLAVLPADLKGVGALGALLFYMISLISLAWKWRASSAREVDALTETIVAMAWPQFSKALIQAYGAQGYAAQQLWACAASNLRRFASPANWRCKATEQDRCRNQLILQNSDFWNLDWYGDWATPAALLS